MLLNAVVLDCGNLLFWDSSVLYLNERQARALFFHATGYRKKTTFGAVTVSEINKKQQQKGAIFI